MKNYRNYSWSLYLTVMAFFITACHKSDPAPVCSIGYTRVNTGFILPQYQFADQTQHGLEWSWTFNGFAKPAGTAAPLVTLYRVNQPVRTELTVTNNAGSSNCTVDINPGAHPNHIVSYTFPAGNITEDFSMNGKAATVNQPPASGTGISSKCAAGIFSSSAGTRFQLPPDLLRSAFNVSKQISVSLWVNIPDLSEDGVILGVVGEDLQNYYIPAIFYAGNKFYGRWNGSQKSGHIASNAITANTWYHIVLNGDGNNNKHELFVNGVSMGTTSDVVSFDHMEYTLLGWAKTLGWPVIGANTSKYFTGSLSAVRFFNRILTQEEVNALYQEKD